MEEIRRSDIKIIVGRDNVVRRTRAESALIREILRHRDHERAYAQLKLTLCAFERLFQRDKSVQPRVQPFFRRLARACVVQNHVGLFFRAWKESTDTYLERSVESGAVTWFAIEAQKAFGENGQAAAEFALALLEIVHHVEKDVVAELLVHGNGAPGLRPDVLKQDRRATNMIAAYLFVSGAFSCPPESANYPGKAWIERLFERMEEPAIVNILQAVMNFSRVLSTADERTRVEYWHQADVEGCRVNEILRIEETVEVGKRKILAPTLMLSERLLPRSKRLLEQRGELAKRQVVCGNQTLATFRSSAERMAHRVVEMREDIERRPRRGLRPKGQDHVEIRLTALNNAGILGLIFHPEGHTFPDVGVEIVFQKTTPHLLTYRTTLGDLLDVRWELLYHSERHVGQERHLHGLLCYTVYDVLHRIVTEDRPLREHPSRNGSADASGRVAVRPYMRKLPAGHRASSEALEAAKRDLGYQPPQGMTFVQAFFRNDELEYDMPSEPFAIYGDEDIEFETAAQTRPTSLSEPRSSDEREVK